MRCLQPRHKEASDPLDYLAVVKALEVFEIPQELWPPVFAYKQRVRLAVETQLKAAYPEAQALLDQICARLSDLEVNKPAMDFWQDGVTAATSCAQLFQTIQVKVFVEIRYKNRPAAYGYFRPIDGLVVVTLLRLDYEEYHSAHRASIKDTILSKQLRTALSILGREQHLDIKFRGAYMVPHGIDSIPVEVLELTL